MKLRELKPGFKPSLSTEKLIVMPNGLWAVVPIKTIQDAKQRLVGVLNDIERQELFRAMVEDVLEALSSAKRLAGILVVTSDPEAKLLATRYGARVLIEERNTGHTAASSFGANTLTTEGVSGMLQVPGDLPLLSANDVDMLAEVHGHARGVTIAPSRDKLGSNGVACSPPNLLPLRFGDDSFFPHIERANALGVEPVIVENQGFALDIDTSDDLQAFLSAPVKRRTLRYLIESGIAERFGYAEFQTT